MLYYILGLISGILLSIVSIICKHMSRRFDVDVLSEKVKRNIYDQNATIVQTKDPLDEIDL